MVAATTFKLLQYFLKQEVAISAHELGVLAVGFAVSFVVALAVIAWFMSWVRTRGFTPFAIYRLFAGAAVLYWLT